MTEGEKTFIRVTNANIYDKLLEIEKHVELTNGKVKLNTVLSRIAITLVLSIFAILASIMF